jgi:DNA modification methylase
MGMKDKTDHPCQMPIEVMNNIVGITEGDIIIDPFSGSGSTLLACEQLNRKWIGIEKDIKYCEMIKKRIELYTKQQKMF